MLSASFSIGVSGLTAFQLKADTHAHNIANANTPNFRRQVITLAEAPAQQKGGFYWGRGVVVSDVRKAGDPFTQGNLGNTRQNLAELEGLASALSGLDDILGSQAGAFTDALGEFRNSLAEASKQPDSLPVRQAVLEAGKALATGYNSLQDGFSDLKSANSFKGTQLLTSANAEAQALASLNKQMLATPSDSLQGNAIGLATEIANKIGGSYKIEPNGTVSMLAENGTPLVFNDATTPITSGYATGGEYGGLVQGNTRIDEASTFITGVASEFFGALNTAHQGGTDLGGGAGVNLFQATGSGYTFMLTDPATLALGQGGGTTDNRNALAMVGTTTDRNTQGGLATVTESLAQQLVKTGAETKATNDQVSSLEQLAKSLEDQFKENTGVNLDEELVQLIQAQRMYEANAKVIQVADSLIGTLLNITA